VKTLMAFTVRFVMYRPLADEMSLNDEQVRFRGVQCTQSCLRVMPYRRPIKVSSMNNGLRRAGIVGLSTLVATSMMALSAAPTYAAAGDYAAASIPQVSQGQLLAPAGALSLEFANSWTTGATQTFTVGTNDCSTAAGIAAAVEFAALPTVVVSDPAPTNSATDTAPILTPGVLGSSNATCATAGIQDRVTLTQALPSTGVATDTYKVDLSVITYNVGATTPKGNISVATAGSFKASGSVVNAVIPIASFTNTAKVAALPSAAGVTLGTQTFDETTAGAFFPAGSTTTVVLTLSAGVLTAGVTPTVTVPAGYTKTNPVTVAPGTYTFTVTAPAAAVVATVTVSGLTITGPAAAQTVTLDALVGAKDVTAVPVVNVVAYDARTGGTDRYATSVALFKSFGNVNDAVLSSGVNFPDALSANYLAGRLGTGTLLTTPNTLPTVVRQAIFAAGVKTVYITGETGAVSQAVQDQVEAMHVGNVPTAALITVVRLGGANRYATNKLVNEFNFPTPANLKNTVLLATGKNFADALTAGPIASNKLFPLILTQGVTLGASETTQLSDFNPTNVVIAGGTGVVSQAIEDSLKTQGYKVLRLAGVDRTLTAAKVATWATDGIDDSLGHTGTGINAPQGFDSTTAYITTGSNFADALSAGPVAGAANHVIMPSNSATSLGSGIPLYLGSKTVGTTAGHTQVGTLHALGLTGAVSAAVMKSAAATIGF